MNPSYTVDELRRMFTAFDGALRNGCAKTKIGDVDMYIYNGDFAMDTEIKKSIDKQKCEVTE